MYMMMATLRLCLVPAALLLAPKSYGLGCGKIGEIMSYYLQSHYSMNRLSDEIEGRTLDNFVKTWDPAKIYFMKADIEAFRDKFASKFASMAKKGNCSAIDAIYASFSKRFEVRYALIPQLIERKYDFTIEESIDLDRKKIDWSVGKKHLDERWRKRIKFQFMQLLDSLEEAEDPKAKKSKPRANLRGVIAKGRLAKLELKVREKLHKRYKLASKRYRELEVKDVYEAFLDAFAKALDPHSRHYPASALEQFYIDTRLSLEGIGAVLRSEDGFTKVQSLVPGGAASRKKELLAEDIIIAVGQARAPPVNVIDMDLQDVVEIDSLAPEEPR